MVTAFSDSKQHNAYGLHFLVIQAGRLETWRRLVSRPTGAAGAAGAGATGAAAAGTAAAGAVAPPVEAGSG